MPDGVQCNIPPFLGGRQQLKPHEVLTTRRITTLRIHVYRAIEKKNYKTASLIPVPLCPLEPHIIAACAFLTLFEETLVSLGSKDLARITKSSTSQLSTQ